MAAFQHVRCSNCGNFAERRLLSDRQAPSTDAVIQTACPVCDYLMVMGLYTGRVIEAYSPGISGHSCSLEHSSTVDPNLSSKAKHPASQVRDLSCSRVLTSEFLVRQTFPA